MKRYFYEGPVLSFGKCIADKWSGTTIASSEAKARNNLGYQYKKRNGKAATFNVTLPGKLIEET